MPSTYSPKLRFELVGAGEQAGLWGTTTNKNMGQLIEQAIAGVTTVELDGLSGNYTLTALDGAPDQSRSAVIKCTYASVIAAGVVNIIIPTQTKLYVVYNDCGRTIYVKTAAQTGGVELLDGESTLVFCDGTDALPGIATASVGTLTVSGGGTGVTTFTAGFVKSPGGTSALTTSSAVSLTADVSGTLPVANGGTGATSLTSGRVLLGAGTSAITALAGTSTNDVLTWNGSAWVAQAPSTSGGTVTSVNVSGGTTGLTTSGGPVTSSGTITLAGTLAATNGGTGNTTYTSGQLLIGNSSGSLTKATLTNGTGISITNGSGSITIASTVTGTVTSVAVSGGTTGLTTSGGPITSSGTVTLAGTLAVANGGTGSTTASGARTALGLGSLATASSVSLTSQVTGVLPTANGGTGTASTINYGFKNRVINGAMGYDQRNVGGAVGTTTANPFLVDRWQLQTNSLTGKFNGGRNYVAADAPTGFLYNIGVTSQSAYSPAAGESFDITQAIEGFNVQDLAWGTASAQSITLSFYVYVSAAGTYAGAIRNAAKDRSYVFTFTVPSGSQNTWYQVTPITIAGDTSGTWDTGLGAGIWLSFSLGAYTTFETASPNTWLNSNYTATTTSVAPVSTNGATFSITGVQLERGATATAFDMRSIGTEIDLCMRYCQVQRTSTAFGILLTGTASSTANTANLTYYPPTPFRTTPTLNYTGGPKLYKESTGSGFDLSSFTVKSYTANTPTPLSIVCVTSTSASFTGGSGVSFADSSVGAAGLFLDAEIT